MVFIPSPYYNRQTRLTALEPSPPRRLSDGAIPHISSADVCEAQGLAAASKPPWEVLELENPDHLECYYCRDLHPIDKIHEYAYSEARMKGPCWKMNCRVRTARFIHPNFSFTVFRMAMKQYRQGKDCNKLLELLA